MAGRIDIHAFSLGDWQTNCYVVHAHAPKALRGLPCWIIDAGSDPGPLLAYIHENGLKPTHVILTHAHLDHIAGLDTIRAAFPEIPILIHANEREFLTDPSLNLSVAVEEPVIAPEATGMLAHGQTLELAGLKFEVRHTPGHSPGGISLYQPDSGVVIVGDALFAGSVGRADFPTSNGPALIDGIRKQLLTLPDATKVYSGHGPPTTIGAERAHNPFLRA
ncbi:MAG: MBL fold metallo-hydrolase [Planctomycetota bacterium]|nr:MBL fold metallo-hydrolase [Planctomycetota bacterium]